MRAATRSMLDLVRTARDSARLVLPEYSHPCSPKSYTQHQLFALMVVRQAQDLDYRSFEQNLRDWSDLREALDLRGVPDHSTLHKAEERLLKKGASQRILAQLLNSPENAA